MTVLRSSLGGRGVTGGGTLDWKVKMIRLNSSSFLPNRVYPICLKTDKLQWILWFLKFVCGSAFIWNAGSTRNSGSARAQRGPRVPRISRRERYWFCALLPARQCGGWDSCSGHASVSKLPVPAVRVRTNKTSMVLKAAPPAAPNPRGLTN